MFRSPVKLSDVLTGLEVNHGPIYTSVMFKSETSKAMCDAGEIGECPEVKPWK